MEFDYQDRRRRFEATMREGALEYADVIKRLNAEGLPTEFTQTGGMNAALEVQLETGRTLLITNAEDSLSWARVEQSGWGVGLYDAGERAAEGATRFASTEEASIESLLLLIAEVLLARGR